MSYFYEPDNGYADIKTLLLKNRLSIDDLHDVINTAQYFLKQRQELVDKNLHTRRQLSPRQSKNKRESSRYFKQESPIKNISPIKSRSEIRYPNYIDDDEYDNY